MVWKGIQVHDVMQHNRLVFVLWAVENSAGKISLLDHYPCNELTKDPNHCFPAITIDLDTSNG
jgi:hypothetical protein